MKDLYITKCIRTLINYFESSNVAFEKVLMLSITMIEKWQRLVHGGGQTHALLTDLSKAFDCIGHEFLIAKLYAHGFDKNPLSFINSYLKGWKQRTKKIPLTARFLISIQYYSTLGITFAIKGGSSRKNLYQ